MSPSWKIVLPLAAVVLIPGAAAVRAAAESDTYKQLDALMDVFERVRTDYVDKVDDKKLIEGAINGMLASLDPHSSYLDARDFQNMRQTTDGEYGGLGLTVTTEDGAVKVVAPTDDTPAARAGIKSGDYITHLDGELIYGTTLQDAVDKMRGAPGTSVKLTVVREGASKPLEFALKREVIQIKPVKFETRGNVGVIRISTFNKQTGDATRMAVTSIEKKLGAAVAGYIIDLRSNPGGLLDQAIDVSDVFLDKGEIVSQRGRTKNDIQRYYAKSGDLTGGKPIVVIVDEGSASAAEIVAGALQDQRRAIVLGQRSFGKGSVQTLIPLSQDTALFHAIGTQRAGKRHRTGCPGAAVERRNPRRPATAARGRPAQAPDQRDQGWHRKDRRERCQARSALCRDARGAEEAGHHRLPARLRDQVVDAPGTGGAGADGRGPARATGQAGRAEIAASVGCAIARSGRAAYLAPIALFQDWKARASPPL
jgi:carboxyl-terminal processing protease